MKECSICLNILDEEKGNIAFTPCNCKVPYHKECLEEWYKYKKTCPICRKELTFNDKYLYIKRYGLIFAGYTIVVLYFFILNKNN